MSNYEIAANAAPSSPPLMNRREASAWLGISERKLDSLAASGELSRIRIGTAVRYEQKDLQVYVDSQKAGERHE